MTELSGGTPGLALYALFLSQATGAESSGRRSPMETKPLRIGSATRRKFAAGIRGKVNLLNHLRRNSLSKSIHVIGRADVHKSSNL